MDTHAAHKQTTALIILDGFGIAPASASNPVTPQTMPFYHALLERYSHSRLQASSSGVGLPEGLMGNSEVGHLTMGAGRVLKTSLVRINDAIEDGSFQSNSAFRTALSHVATHGSSMHLMGLLSDGGIHSSIEHLFALIDLCADAGVPTYIHCFLDGRDTPPKSALTYLRRLEDYIASHESIHISTLGGRYFGMDRDQHWDRVQKAYDALTGVDRSKAFTSAEEAVKVAYMRGQTDEFVEPCMIDLGSDTQFISSDDACIFFNFRTDRPKELTAAFSQPSFEGFERARLENLSFVCMTAYDESYTNVEIAFPPEIPEHTLPSWLATHGRTQFHTAETEKYAHVTYFFNGGVEQPLQGETRKLIPSPKVATYDQQPAMSALAVKDAVLEALRSRNYDFLVVNFANPDMVGHTGNLEATREALATIDTCLREIVETLESLGGNGILTADHGNCEHMQYENGSKHTAHTTSLVPCVLLGATQGILEDGTLADVAPTILALMDVEKPKEMTGKSLLSKPKTI